MERNVSTEPDSSSYNTWLFRQFARYTNDKLNMMLDGNWTIPHGVSYGDVLNEVNRREFGNKL